MHIEIRIAITLLCHALIMFLVGELNRLLSPLHLALMVDALYLVFSALFFRVWPGVIITTITAAAVFCVRPFPYTIGVLLYPVLTLIATRMRIRIRRENPRHLVLVALLLNSALFLVYTLHSPSYPAESQWWLRLGCDFVLSQTVILLLAAPWAHLQRRLLYTFGIDVGAELQHI